MSNVLDVRSLKKVHYLRGALLVKFDTNSRVEKMSQANEVPNCFKCPISLQLMKDPVILSGSGLTYDRPSIENWLQAGTRTCPVSMQALESTELIPNHPLQRNILNWCRVHLPETAKEPQRMGVAERKDYILSVHQLVKGIDSSSGNDRVWRLQKLRGMLAQCGEIIGESTLVCVGLISLLYRTVASHKTSNIRANVLAVAEEDPSDSSSMGRIHLGFWRHEDPEEVNDTAVEITLDILATISRHDKVRAFIPPIGQREINTLAWFLTFGNMNAKSSIARLLTTVLIDDEPIASASFSAILKALINILKERRNTILEPARIDSLEALLTMSLSDRKNPYKTREIRLKAIRHGGLTAVLGFLPGASGLHVEKALGLLETFCLYDEGRRQFCRNSSAMTVLLKEIGAVSEAVTRSAMSILQLLVRYSTDPSVQESAVEQNVCMILVLLMYSQSSLDIRQKAKDLLRLIYIKCTIDTPGRKCVQ